MCWRTRRIWCSGPAITDYLGIERRVGTKRKLRSACPPSADICTAETRGKPSETAGTACVAIGKTKLCVNRDINSQRLKQWRTLRRVFRKKKKKSTGARLIPCRVWGQVILPTRCAPHDRNKQIAIAIPNIKIDLRPLLIIIILKKNQLNLLSQTWI